jgi:hypothetical protein
MTKFSLDAKIGSREPRRQNGPLDQPELGVRSPVRRLNKATSNFHLRSAERLKGRKWIRHISEIQIHFYGDKTNAAGTR